MKDKVAYLTLMTCFPELLMIINMQISPGSKKGAQWSLLIITLEHHVYK